MATPKRSLSPAADSEGPDPKRARIGESESTPTAVEVTKIQVNTPDVGKSEEPSEQTSRAASKSASPNSTEAAEVPSAEITESTRGNSISSSPPSYSFQPDPLVTLSEVEEQELAKVWDLPNRHGQARLALQRSIAMVLRHDGFATATPTAMESFTQMVETYMESMISEVQALAQSARRDHPLPTDFEVMLRRHNVPVASLKPHLKPPIPKDKVNPIYGDSIPVDRDAFRTLPLLGKELSGQPDKDSKPYIPSAFPDFPSKHTYTFTPQEDKNVRDPKAIREQAARTAQEGEEALRRLVRASKTRKQKEVKLLVERDAQGKERFRLWEQTMKRFMGAESREHLDQVDIADHSMIVNGEVVFQRKEVSRLGKRGGLVNNKTIPAAKNGV